MDKSKIMNKMVETRGENKTIWLENVRPITLHGRTAGSKFRVLCDKNGTPLDYQTRRRFNDKDFVVCTDRSFDKMDKKPEAKPKTEEKKN